MRREHDGHPFQDEECLTSGLGFPASPGSALSRVGCYCSLTQTTHLLDAVPTSEAAETLDEFFSPAETQVTIRSQALRLARAVERTGKDPPNAPDTLHRNPRSERAGGLRRALDHPRQSEGRGRAVLGLGQRPHPMVQAHQIHDACVRDYKAIGYFVMPTAKSSPREVCETALAVAQAGESLPPEIRERCLKVGVVIP